MNTSGLLQDTRSTHDSMNRPKIEFYCLYVHLHFIYKNYYNLQKTKQFRIFVIKLRVLSECKTEIRNSQREHGQPMDQGLVLHARLGCGSLSITNTSVTSGE